MATGGAFALAAGYAHADADAAGVAANSPGVVSGNVVQLPVAVPVNICGNTVNVVGLLNPAAGNRCENRGGQDAENDGGHGGNHKDEHATPHGGGASGKNSGGASAEAAAVGSPGVIAGNGLQLPVDLPVNVSGNSVNLVGVLNPAFGNTSVNGGGDEPAVNTPKPPEENEPVAPPKPDQPRPSAPSAPAPAPLPAPEAAAPAPEPQAGSTSLARTGADDLLGVGLPAAAGLMLAGGLLHRRFRRVPAPVAEGVPAGS
ncbi:chaplin [Streptomyces sp. HMX112]|uniref:chaplin n=1 Tax=Streptomyces sp. HMX112 TaxID=3390850 RepID=UPI003A80C722